MKKEIMKALKNIFGILTILVLIIAGFFFISQKEVLLFGHTFNSVFIWNHVGFIACILYMFMEFISACEEYEIDFREVYAGLLLRTGISILPLASFYVIPVLFPVFMEVEPISLIIAALYLNKIAYPYTYKQVLEEHIVVKKEEWERQYLNGIRSTAYLGILLLNEWKLPWESSHSISILVDNLTENEEEAMHYMEEFSMIDIVPVPGSENKAIVILTEEGLDFVNTDEFKLVAITYPSRIDYEKKKPGSSTVPGHHVDDCIEAAWEKFR